MANPIQYSELFLPDVETGLKEIQALAAQLDTTFQGLAKTLLTTTDKVSASIKTETDILVQLKEAVNNVNVAQKGAADALVKVGAEADKATERTRKHREEQEKLKDVFNLSTASIDQIKARIAELTKEYTAMAGATDKTNQQTQKARLEIAQLKLVQDGLNATMKNATLSIKGAEGSYNQMNATLIRLKQELKDLPNSINAQTGAWNKNNPAVKEHVDKINELDKALKKVDASMGDHQREVGNYAEEIKKALYDLIPFGSELGRVGHAVEELAPVLVAGAESLGLLSISLIAIPALGAAIAGSGLVAYFTQTQDGIDSVTRAIEPLKIELKSAIGDLEDFGRETSHFFVKLTTDTFNFVDRGIKSIQQRLSDLIPMSDKARAEFEKSKANFKDIPFDTQTGAPVDNSKAEALTKLSNEIVNLQIKIEENENKLILETGKLNRQFQDQAEIARNTLLVGIEGENQRKEAAQKAIETSKELEKIRVADLNDKLKLITLQQSINHNEAELRESIKERNTIQASIDQTAADADKERRRITALSNSLELGDIKDLAEQEKKRAAAQKKFFEDQVKDSLKLFDSEKKSSDAQSKAKDELAKDIKVINDKNQKYLEANLKEFSKLFDEVTKKGDEMAADVAKNDQKIIDEAFKLLDENAKIIGQLFGKNFGDLFKSLSDNLRISTTDFEDWAKTAIAASGSIDEAFQKGTDNRIASLQLEKQAQIDIAGTNATARLNIEKIYNDKIREEKQKQARIDKEAALFDIAVNTFVAASKVLGETGLLGIPLVPVVIALGALQAAAVLARPIPQFAGGTQNAPAGLAEVAEQGAEAIQSPSGHLRIAHKRQVTYLEKGSKVFTSEETRRMLDVQQIDRMTEVNYALTAKLRTAHREEQIGIAAAAFQSARISEDAISRGVGREIAKLPLQNFTLDQRGYSHFIQTESTKTKVLNERYSLK